MWTLAEVLRFKMLLMAGLASLSKTFGLCSAMESSHDYRHFLFWLRNNFVTLSMFDYPYPTRAITRLPGYPVQVRP